LLAKFVISLSIEKTGLGKLYINEIQLMFRPILYAEVAKRTTAPALRAGEAQVSREFKSLPQRYLPVLRYDLFIHISFYIDLSKRLYLRFSSLRARINNDRMIS
jgi:hypothetical protein